MVTTVIRQVSKEEAPGKVKFCVNPDVSKSNGESVDMRPSPLEKAEDPSITWGKKSSLMSN